MFFLFPYSSLFLKILLSLFGKTKVFSCFCRFSSFFLSIFFMVFMISLNPDIHPLITPRSINISVNGKRNLSSNFIPKNVHSKIGVTMVKPTCEISDKYFKASISHTSYYTPKPQKLSILHFILIFFGFLIIPI